MAKSYGVSILIEVLRNLNKKNQKKKGQKRDTIVKLQHYTQYSENGTICKLCAVDYNSMSKLLMHMHRYHKQRDALECPVCCKY